MKNVFFVILFLILLSGSFFAQSSEDAEKESVKEVVQKAIDANYNSGNIELIKKYYHPGFNLLTETAVPCMKLGTLDYLVKPIESDSLINAVNRAIKFYKLNSKNK